MAFVRKDDVLRDLFGINKGRIDSILKNKTFCIPMVSLGEAFHQIRKKDPKCYSEPLNELNRLLDSGYLVTRYINDSTSTFSLAKEISAEVRDRRDQISPMDALIVSSAATDQTCSQFYTSDVKLISNSRVSDLITEWREDRHYCKMKILDASSLFRL